MVSIDAAHAAGELSFTTGGTATEFTAAHAAGELSFTTDNTHADVSALSVEQAAALSFTTDSVSTLIQARQLERLTYDSTKSVGLIIPDNDLTGITSTVNVSVDGEILGVSVDTSVTHPYSSDIVLALTSPSGTVFYPNDLAGSTALFNGESVVGDWTLHVYDQWEYDEGTLNSWTLNIEYHHGIDRAVFTTGAAVAVRADTGYLSAASTYERELYILQIDHDTLPSIRVPMSSFTVRQSEGGTAYLEANIPEYAQALDINARSGGSMSLFYVLDRGGFRSETIAYTTDDLTVRSNLGSSSASVTLSGTFTPAAGGDREIALSGSSYYSSGTTERVRCSFDPLIRIGDTVNSEESGAFVVVSTVYTITPETRTFEVSS
ncbi:MAG: proprotein convertase P-domain-containing protein [Pontibacterium sp.]